MAALDVIGKNLQLGFGVDQGLFAEQEVVVLLECVCLLGNLADKDLPVEDRPGTALEYAALYNSLLSQCG